MKKITGLVEVEMVGGGPHDGERVQLAPQHDGFLFKFSGPQGVHQYQQTPGATVAWYQGYTPWGLR